ncbi:hypothetical protein EDD15DRAFT_2191384 [Pisolithus albus]|nr:hypothetical protein EDD15DRAFT_2191384 [Pisolithus albus]
MNNNSSAGRLEGPPTNLGKIQIQNMPTGETSPSQSPPHTVLHDLHKIIRDYDVTNIDQFRFGASSLQRELFQRRWMLLLIRKHYPSFKQTWFTNRSDERTAHSTKRKTKTETMAGDMMSPMPKCVKLHVASRSDDGEGDASISVATSSSTSDTSFIGPFTQSSPALVGSHHTMSDADAPPDDSAPMPGSSIALDTSAIKQGDTGFKISLHLIKNPLLSVPQKQPAVDGCPPQQAPNILVEVRDNDSLLPGSSDHISSGLSQVNHADIQGAESLTGSARTHVTSKGNREEDVAPPTYKSAQTLCMHRYRKQISGCPEEFNLYWDALSEEPKAKYKSEAKELIASGVWSSGTSSVIAKFSSPPLCSLVTFRVPQWRRFDGGVGGGEQEAGGGSECKRTSMNARYEYTGIGQTPTETPIFYAGRLPSMAYEGLLLHCYSEYFWQSEQRHLEKNSLQQQND